MTKYGIIGSGMMAHEHINNLHLFEGARVVAVADPDEAMRGSAMALAGAKGYETHNAMLAAEDLDALIIAAPNHTHHAILRDVLATEIPVLCEKPLGVSDAQCRDIAGWTEARQAPVWVAMEYRYMEPMQRLLAETGKGTAGQPRMVTIREHRFPFLEKVGDWNRFSANTGGTLVEKCCHHFDLMRLILGVEAVRVYASAGVDVNHLDERYDGQTPDIFDNAYVIVEFEGGVRGMLELSMFAEGAYWQEIVTVVGDKARIEARIPGSHGIDELRHGEVSIGVRASLTETTEVIETDPKIMAAGAHHGSTYYQHAKFLDLVRNGGTPEVSVADGAAAVRIGAAAEESARSGQPVYL